MHKFFAKPLYLGKKIIFLPECHSTNDELSDLIRRSNEPEGIILYTDHQTKGKGQRGNVWLDDPGKNILMSILIKPKSLPVVNQYLLNVLVGLAVFKTFSRYMGDQKLKLKWPNDVMYDGRKIAGILIENSLRSSTIENSIVGIGINLNQETFQLPTAISLRNVIDAEINRLEFMECLTLDLEYFLQKLKNHDVLGLRAAYHDVLYLIDSPSTFKDHNGIFTGTIQGIDDSGKLIMLVGNEVRKYQVKELSFI